MVLQTAASGMALPLLLLLAGQAGTTRTTAGSGLHELGRRQRFPVDEGGPDRSVGVGGRVDGEHQKHGTGPTGDRRPARDGVRDGTVESSGETEAPVPRADAVRHAGAHPNGELSEGRRARAGGPAGPDVGPIAGRGRILIGHGGEHHVAVGLAGGPGGDVVGGVHHGRGRIPTGVGRGWGRGLSPPPSVETHDRLGCQSRGENPTNRPHTQRAAWAVRADIVRCGALLSIVSPPPRSVVHRPAAVLVEGVFVSFLRGESTDGRIEGKKRGGGSVAPGRGTPRPARWPGQHVPLAPQGAHDGRHLRGAVSARIDAQGVEVARRAQGPGRPQPQPQAPGSGTRRSRPRTRCCRSPRRAACRPPRSRVAGSRR